MKTLVIIRHAKSSWDHPDLEDFDRPLNERGKRDAPEMARRLALRGLHPDLLLSSPARRAYSTAKRFADAFHYPKERIRKADALYHASAGQLLRALHELDEQLETVLLFGHNPGLTELVNEISNLHTDNIPTCGVVVLQLTQWKLAGKEEARLLAYDYPKNAEG